jgi:two-component system CheB/CheR fusion protein
MSISTEPVSDPEEEQGLQRSKLVFPVVGIGASPGGFVTVERLLEHLPSTTEMAFVVVLHLLPDHPSMADAIFQGCTRMTVCMVNDEMPLQPDHVFVIPPNRSLSLNDGHLRLGRLERTSSRHVTIDRFFRRLGTVYRERVVALVLCGADGD